MIPRLDIRIGDVREQLRKLPAGSVQCCVTSPPYWGLRAYGTVPQIWGGRQGCEHQWQAGARRHKVGPHGAGVLLEGGRSVVEAQAAMKDYSTGQFCAHCGAWLGELGLEPTPALYVSHMREVFRLIRRALRPDGTCWMNLGDTYAGGGLGGGGGFAQDGVRMAAEEGTNKNIPARNGTRLCGAGLKPKDLVGIPWRVALALQRDGWWLRSDVVWSKPSPMPESCRDRPTKAHEYVFLLTKSDRYFYNTQEAREPTTGGAHPRGNGVNPKAKKTPAGWDTGEGDHKALSGRYPRTKQNESFSSAISSVVEMRNWRSVWEISSQPYAGAHFATFPTALAKRCIVAGTIEGSLVLDPFGGSGTTGEAALDLNRNALLIDLDPRNEELMRDRCAPHLAQGRLAL